MLQKIISGGQTGVDRAALDVALERDMAVGGWCPKGRLAEDGVLSGKYPLTETPSDEYDQRTEWNVRDADGTLILTHGEPTGGTAYTIEMAIKLGKPYFIVDFDKQAKFMPVLKWVEESGIKVLNVAGPRGSGMPGIYSEAEKFLIEILDREKGKGKKEE